MSSDHSQDNELVSCSLNLEGQYGVIELRRPGYRNAMTVPMIDRFCEHLSALEDDHRIKSIIIRAQGPDLCAGLHLAQAADLYAPTDGDEPGRLPSLRARFRAHDKYFWGSRGLYSRVVRCSKVTILAARGLCHGPGFYLALCCDLSVASHDALFANPRWRQIGVDGDLSLLINAVGLKRAKEFVYCGAQWTAAQALGYGLIDEVVAPDALDDKAVEFASIIAPMVRDGIAAEKYVAMAALEKLHVGTGFAIATMMGAMASNVHFRPGEFNFLRALRDGDPHQVLRDAAADFADWTHERDAS